MRALSLRQPWANAVLYLGKTIENRGWDTKFRGEFLIHAASGMTVREHEAACEWCEDVLGLPRCFEIKEKLDPVVLKRGGIVGKARLVSVLPPRPSDMIPYGPKGIYDVYPKELADSGAWRWHMGEQYGFVLEDVKPLPFVACKGALGFFEVPTSVMKECGL